MILFFVSIEFISKTKVHSVESCFNTSMVVIAINHCRKSNANINATVETLYSLQCHRDLVMVKNLSNSFIS